MKKLLFITSLVLITSCGKDLRRAIGADYNNKTNRIEKDVDQLDERVTELEKKVQELQDADSNLQNLITNLDAVVTANAQNASDQLEAVRVNLQDQINDIVNNELPSLKADITSLGGQVTSLNQLYNNLNTSIISLQNGATSLQGQVNSLLTRIVALESSQGNAPDRITEIVDPCPSINATWKEVLIKTASGKYFAYFEDGGRRFLTVLPVGNFQTTDSRRCPFTLNSNGTITN